MPKQTHIIKRQVMEIVISSEKNAFKLQNRISSICHGGLIPVLDRICSELSPPGQVHRIPRLTIDIGTLFPGFSEERFIDRIKGALKQRLSEKISTPKHVSFSANNEKNRPRLDYLHGVEGVGPGMAGEYDQRPDPFMGIDRGARIESDSEFFSQRLDDLPGMFSKEKKETENSEKDGARKTEARGFRGGDIELLEFFIETGTVPWWVEKNDSGAAVVSLERLATSDPDALKRMLSELALNEIGMTRLIFQFPDRLLEKVANLFHEDLKQRAIVPAGVVVREMREIFPEEFRLEIWRGAFLSMMARRRQMVSPGGMQEDIFFHVLKSDTISPIDFFQTARRRIHALEKSGHAFKSGILNAVKQSLKKIGETQEKTDPGRRGLKKGRESLKERAQVMPEIPKTGKYPFSDIEEIFAGNAGLVLLHEFLPGFFEKTGLMADDRFVSYGAERRAVLLLQHLVDGGVEAPEQTLCLNKILCGVDLAEPVEKWYEPSKKEKMESDALLTRAMEMSPGIKEMSVDEFRSVFLQRDGSLSVRDRTWLLRVKSEGRDILLDGLFFTARPIALPWMPDPLFVEWS